MSEPETPKARFFRNHEEDLSVMRCKAVAAARDGRDDDARRIRAIIEKWEEIGRLAEGLGDFDPRFGKAAPEPRR